MQINVLAYFEEGSLVSCPSKVAVVDQGTLYTFSELERRSKNCAAYIIKRASSFSQPIAVFLPKSVHTIVANLGILYSGNCYANLDIKSPPARLLAILKNLEPGIIITSETCAPILLNLGIPEQQLMLMEAATVDGANYDNSQLLLRLDQIIDTDPLCIIHTSGSTGVPKGVALNHRCTIDFMDWVFQRLGLDGSEIIGSLSPFYFDIYTLELYLALAKGSTLVIIPEQCAAFPSKLLEFMTNQAVNFIFWVPTIMVNIANQNLLEFWPMKSLKTVFFAGEVFPTKHLNYWRRHLGAATFVNLYGPIETSVDCTYFVVNREMGDDEKLPIGYPCRNTDILILNDKDEAVVGEEPGELCVRGSSLGLGYWNNPERTAQAFTQNPLNKHYPELIYRTGDLVYRNPRGEIMFIGRKDFQIKHMGYRIELGEIEHAALQIDQISNACVTYNSEQKSIVLFFESGCDYTIEQLRTQLVRHIPKYMLPTKVMRLDLLPKNPNGKIDRQTLTKLQ